MHSQLNARAKNLPEMGDILQSFERFRNLIPHNDGKRNYKQIIKSSYPTSFNGDSDAKLAITDNEFDITALNDSTIQVEGVAQYRMDTSNPFNTTLGTDLIHEETNYVFVGFKSSSQVLRQIQLLINDRPDLCNFLNPNVCQEAFAYLACSSETKRENKPGMYSLYDDVWNKNPFVCGNYICMRDIRRNNGVGSFRFKYLIPINDILAFQALDMFPSSIMGVLSLIISFQFAGAVWCPVSFSAVKEQLQYLGTSFTGYAIDANNIDADLSHEFLQVGTEYGRCYLTTTDGTFLGTHTTMKMNITSFTIEKLKSRLSGYGVNEATKNSMLNDIRQSPFLIPAQKLERQTFGTGIISSGAFDATISTTLRNINCISTMFTTHENNITIYRNPMVRNLQLTIGNVQYPPERISTLTTLNPEFVSDQLQACELDGEIVPSKSFMRSLTNERLIYTIDSAGNANVTGRNTNCISDGTDFMFTIATERKQGGFVFDGLTTESNVNINLKFEPIASNEAYNPYYNFDTVNYPNKHPSAPTLHYCKDVFWEIGIGNDGPYMLFNDSTLDPVK